MENSSEVGRRKKKLLFLSPHLILEYDEAVLPFQPLL